MFLQQFFLLIRPNLIKPRITTTAIDILIKNLITKSKKLKKHLQ